MKKLLSLVTFAACSLMASAQDPILMTIAGKPVTRGEFEYSYNKNSNVEGAVELKTIEEYVPMFVNYKLKVAAAEEARYDTLTSFRKEFLQYRDMQLTPYMVDEVYIDSVARSIYNRTAEQLGGKDLLSPAHILIALRQDAGETEAARAKTLADSLYTALQEGADFAALARQFSADPGTAQRGGQLPLIGPGSTVPEFENAAYKLQVGEMCAPVKTAYGYHIIKMTSREQLASYDSLSHNIIMNLRRQGIEDRSAEARIARIVEQSNGRLTREAVLDSVLAAHLDNPELRFLVQEYHDGLLLYEISKQRVWDPAEEDQEGLAAYYKENKKKYAWTEPRFKGFVLHCKNAKDLKPLKKLLKKEGEGNWRAAVKETFNKDSVSVHVAGPYLCKKNDNKYVDAYVFKTGKEVKTLKGYAVTDVQGKVLKQPASWKDVKAQVVADYQALKEEEWVNGLNARFPVEIDQEVLKTVNNHK